MDVDAQLEHIFAAVINSGPFTIAQVQVIKEKVPRLRRLKREQRANMVTDTPATEPLVLTPTELTQVGELKWKKVTKGEKAEFDNMPHPIRSSNQFSVIALPAHKDEKIQKGPILARMGLESQKGL